VDVNISTTSNIDPTSGTASTDDSQLLPRSHSAFHLWAFIPLSMSPNAFNALSMAEAALPPDLIPLAHKLLSASQVAPPSELKRLIDQGAPAWFQDEELGWSCLHYAAERREPECLRILLQGGAVWNAVDRWGRTAGEVCLSLGDREGWEMIRNEGVRSGG
jgi:ankyrin repeat protein